MPKHEIVVVACDDVIRRALHANAEVMPGERIEHRLTMIPAGNSYTAKFQTVGVAPNGVERMIDGELHLTAVFQMKGDA